ncbi:Ff.00g036250.m01.CDS01 [Fusarium sp. VM40]|nr:Ff.00g036250.m01.CDS01 [Fusarium sp. VM40]
MCEVQHPQTRSDKQQQDSSTSNPVSTSTPALTPRSAQGTADHTSQVETFSIPATGSDFDHRTMITIQSQQQQIPQDIWLHSPWHRVLYQPAWGYPLQPGDNKVPAEAAKPETNGHTDKGSSA